MQIATAILIDDESSAIKKLQIELKNTNVEVVGSSTNQLEAINKLEKNQILHGW